MKIAIVHNAYGKVSGEEMVIDSLAALLEKRGMTVLRYSRSSAEIEDKRLGKISAFFSGIHNPFSRKAFGRFLRETHPDVVHIHNSVSPDFSFYPAGVHGSGHPCRDDSSQLPAGSVRMDCF